MGPTDETETMHVTRLQRISEERVFNPLFRWLLRTRLHWLASRWLLLVSYTGRRTGRRYRMPVMYARRGNRLVVVTPERESTWWRNFEEPLDCRVWYRGLERQATGELVRGDERDALLAEYFETHGVFARLLGVSPEDQPEQFNDLVVVQFQLG